jgi:hypothetical protein
MSQVIKSKLTRVITALITLIIVGVSSIALLQNPSQAANASNFDPGNIIDDVIFYNDVSMTRSQIQAFLDARMPNCDTDGTQPASDWGRPDITHAQLASYIRNGTNGYTKDTGFHAPPYICLRDYEQNVPQMEAASGLCSGITAKADQTAAQIIKSISAACGINPQVLIVLLQKEQSLVTDNWPLRRQYSSATGFDCPDTAPCDPAYAGFFYQVYYAARQFKIYKAYPNDYNYIAGRTNRIYWHPDLSRCGSSNVYIQNQATAALYIYTPYRPNQAALNNLYGTGDSCSSYGNRNFWRLFTDWFGSTLGSFENMNDPRYLRLASDLQKTNIRTGAADGVVLPAGTELYFTTRYIYNDELYVRTESDTKNKLDRGIRFVDLLEVLPFESIHNERYLRLTSDLRKTNLRTGEDDGVILPADTVIYFTNRYEYNGELYVRSQFDTRNRLERGIRYSDLFEMLAFEPIENPRYLRLTSDLRKTNLRTGEDDGAIIPAGTRIYFTTRYEYEGKLYVRSQSDTNELLERGIRYSDLESVN